MKNVLINYMGRNNSGPLIALEIAKSLNKLGYNVYVVMSKYISNREDWYQYDFAGIHEVDTYRSAKDLPIKTAKFCIRDRLKIKKQFSGIKMDMVIKTLFHPWADVVTDLFKGAKVVTYCHDPIMHSGVSSIEHILCKAHIKHSDEIIVLTKSFIPIVVEKYGFSEKNIHFSPHGKLGTYKEKQSDECTDNAFKYNESKTNFMFFGRIQEYKGLHVLAKAYEILKASHKNITLTVIGSGDFGDYREEFGKLEDVNVVNRYIADEEVGWCFTGDNLITVLPYNDATQSGVIPIAMEYGVPIIASSTGGLMEQLYDGEIGVFCKTNDPKDLAEKMERFLLEEGLYKEQQEIMATKMKDLEWDVILARLMNELSGR